MPQVTDSKAVGKELDALRSKVGKGLKVVSKLESIQKQLSEVASELTKLKAAGEEGRKLVQTLEQQTEEAKGAYSRVDDLSFPLFFLG